MTNTPILIDAPGHLIAAIPALMGFVPATDSFLVIALTGDTVLFTARNDTADALRGVVDSLVPAIVRNDVDKVVAVTVADPADGKAAVVEHMLAVRELMRVTDVIGSYRIATLAEPALAQNLDTLDVFYVDPTSSVVAATAVAAGRSIDAGREDIAAWYAHGDPVAPAADADPASVLEELATVVQAGAIPDDELVARTAAVVTAIPARDAMFRLAAYGPRSAHTVMATIARRSRGLARVHALCIAGWAAHITGNGTAANVAYDAAEADAVETCNLLTLLRRALDAAVNPDQMSEMLPDEATVFALTGACLPGEPPRR